MRTNIVINEILIEQALKLGGFKTKKEAVEEGLKLIIRFKNQEAFRKYKGKLKWQDNLEQMRLD